MLTGKALKDYPDLLKEWDYEQNSNINPFELPSQSNKRVWWKCSVCGHEWQASIQRKNWRLSLLQKVRTLNIPTLIPNY